MLGCLVVSLWLAASFELATANAQNPQQATNTPTSTRTTSPLPTATRTPTPTITPTPTQTPTVTPTALPNQLLCFKSSSQNVGGLLLAWQMSTVDKVADFRLFRAVVVGEGQRTQFIESSLLLPPIPPATAQPIQATIRYTTTDRGAVDGTQYVYKLEVIGNDDTLLDSREADSPPAGSVADPEICDPTRTQPTATPTLTLTPVVFPTSTPTPTRTATPTWTPTPTITLTPTWTWTPLPADTATPIPTGTWTPTPTNTPEPATETPTPTFTVTPTFTPNIQQPTAEAEFVPIIGGGENPPPPSQDAPPDTPTPEPPPEPTPPVQEEVEPFAALRSLPGDEPEASEPANAKESAQDNSLAEADAASEESLPGEVRVNDFRPRLLPRGQADLFRYGLFGLAGLAFLGAFGFLLAGIGLGRSNRE